MAETTNIEWTDATWQIVTGCSVLSPGCTNCYAMKLAGTRLRNHHSRKDLTKATKAGPVWNGMVRFNVGWLHQPLTWRKPRDIFVAAHGDLFHEAVQRWMLVKVFAVMAMAHWHRFQVLTKRADRMREFVTWLHTEEGQWEMARAIEELGIRRFYTWPLPNVWLGVSVEDQTRADERIPDLLTTAAAVRWISAEPLLGPLDLSAWPDRCWLRTVGADGAAVRPGIDWVVAGGESGPDARPMHPDWARSLRDQCQLAGVPFFFKQWGNWAPTSGSEEDDVAVFHDGGTRSASWLWRADENERHGVQAMRHVGKKKAGALLDGREFREFPNTGAHP